MMRLAVFFLSFWLAACSGEPAPIQPAGGKPMRIVSLDYCADQFVLKFVPRERILAVSPDGVKDFSYMRDAAAGLPTVRPVAEDVIVLKPDLVVRSYGGGPNAAAYFERVGIQVIEVGYAGDIEGVLANVERLADELGAAERGRQVVAETRARLAALADEESGRDVLYVTPSGATTGPGSLIHEMMERAGLRNFEARAGWHSIPLERLAYDRPDLLAGAFFDTADTSGNAWSAAKHPMLRRQLDAGGAVEIDGAATACGGWYLVDVVEALAEGARR